MIKNLELNGKEVRVNIKLKDGGYFEEMDVPEEMISPDNKIIAFWVGEVVRMYSLSDVEYYEVVTKFTKI